MLPEPAKAPKPPNPHSRHFPKMIYKDIDGDGDVSQPNNQLTVINQAELDAKLAEGWVEHPSELGAA